MPMILYQMTHTIIRNMRDFVPQFVKMLKNGKSVGIDLISNEMIKCCIDSHFVRLIRELFNFILVESNQSSDILQQSQNRPTGDRWLKF